jgi:hypothetical protein
MTEPIVESDSIEEGELIEIDDIIQSHITVKDYKMSFVQFMELSREVPVSRQQWLILIALLETFNSCNRTKEAMKNRECREVAIRTQSLLDSILDPRSDILFSNRNGAGALILLEVICGIVEGIDTIFTTTLDQVKSKKPLPLPELAKKFRSIHKVANKTIKRGFGAQEAKSVDQLSMVVHPIINEAHFGSYLGLLSDSGFVFGFMVHGYNRDKSIIATADGFFYEPTDKFAIPYFERVEETEVGGPNHQAIFAYADSIGIKAPLHSPDSFESYFVNLRYFLDVMLPQYLNSPLVSKRYQKGLERLKSLYINYCHVSLQDSIRISVANQLDDYLTKADESDISRVVTLIKSNRRSQIKSIGKIIGLQPNWIQILTPDNLTQVISDFVDIADYFTETTDLEIINDDTNDLEPELISDDQEITIEMMEDFEVSFALPQSKTRLLSNPLIQWASNSIVDKHSLALNCTIKILDSISDMITHLASMPEYILDVKTLMQFGLTPHLFNSQPMITPKRLAIFDTSTNQINAGSLEVKVGAATRLFIELIDERLVVTFFGNPDYHK